jgi:Mg2+-importing ATPase
MAGVVVNTVAYHAGYAASLAVALAILLARGRGSALILAASALFVVVAFLLALTVLVLSSRDSRAGTRALRRAPVVKTVLALLRQAEPRLTRRPWLHVRAAALQIAIGLLDAATIWVLIQSLGATAAPADVFASFAIATLFRTIGVVPGGLGTFEAASVVTLNLAGVAVPVALSATLLFRGFSFWLPMLPGLWLSRAVMRDVTAPERA